MMGEKQTWWRRVLRPGPVVASVIVSSAIAWWVVFVLWWQYGVDLNAVDVAINIGWFVSLTAWWTDYLTRDK